MHYILYIAFVTPGVTKKLWYTKGMAGFFLAKWEIYKHLTFEIKILAIFWSKS